MPLFIIPSSGRNPRHAFATIDQVLGGGGWPNVSPLQIATTTITWQIAFLIVVVLGSCWDVDDDASREQIKNGAIKPISFEV